MNNNINDEKSVITGQSLIRNVVWLPIAMLIIVGAGMAAYSVWSIRSQGEEEIKRFRAQRMQAVEDEIKGNIEIAFATIASTYERASSKEYLESAYGHRLKNIIDVTENVVLSYKARADSGAMPVEEAKKEAMQAVKKLTYDGTTGYVWINDMTRPLPKMIMHPTVPSLDGTVLDKPNFYCALGAKENLFKAMVDVCAEKGEGFVDYVWPKKMADGSMKQGVAKLSYVRRVKGWDWVLGTGIYVDDAIEDAKEDIKNIVRRMRYDNGVGYFWINDMTKPLPKMIMNPLVPSLEGKVLDSPKYDNAALNGTKNLFAAVVDICAKNKEGAIDYVWPKEKADGTLTDPLPKLSYVKLYEPLGWVVGTGVYTDDIQKEIAAREARISREITSSLLTIIPTIAAVIIALLLFLYRRTSKTVVKPILNVFKAINAICEGSTDEALALKEDQDKRVTSTIRKLVGVIKSMASHFRERTVLLQNIAEGRLDDTIAVASDRDAMGIAMVQMNDELNRMVSEIDEAAEQVNSGSDQVSEASQSLSQGATEQAASLEEVSSSLTEIASQTKTNAENATLAQNITVTAREAAERGNGSMKEMLTAMGDISQSSKEISKIIKVIDDIAFQTNLLALNASVEAARAGVHGKGFAVVAEEVRNLAGRCAKAASETSVLIEGSLKKVDNGTGIANETASALVKIVEEITRASDLVGEIAAASNEQAGGVSQVNQGLVQIDSVTQQNTANAEETAAAAEELSSQATHMRALLSRFVLREGMGGGRPAPAPAVAEVGYQAPQPKRLPSGEWGASGSESGKAPSPSGQIANPEDIISLDSDEFGKY